ncbi:MAG: D-alanyl-D-alanine carboxypeptidase [Lachnospiraceae bacterium]|nr:D-alanyl-D-alanine carboxypeptidase [Lachnospiraceae bacterium]
MFKWKKYIVTTMIILLILVDLPVLAKEPAETELYAKAAVLMDAESGRVLYEKNGQEILAMASTTKILTCILTLEMADLEEWVDISAYASTMPKVKLGVTKGERYRLGDLLYSLMLESHNDVAVAIAEHIGKEFLEKELAKKSVSEYTVEESKKAVAAFADLMNEKAHALGCANSWFITPNGLDAIETFHAKDGTTFTKDHSTTAEELARIMSYCVVYSPKKEEFLRITQTISHVFTSDKGRNHFCTNHNAFLTMMDGVISGKTGFTNKAGYCYVGALERDERTFVVALLACGWPNNKSYKWSDSKKLMSYGIEEFFEENIEDVQKESMIPTQIPVTNGQTLVLGQQAYVNVKVLPTEEEGILWAEAESVLLKEGEQVVFDYELPSMLQAPVRKGDIVGKLTYCVDGNIYRQKDIVLTEDVKEVDFRWCFEKVFDIYLGRNSQKE